MDSSSSSRTQLVVAALAGAGVATLLHRLMATGGAPSGSLACGGGGGGGGGGGSKRYLGIDLGGTTVTVGIIDDSGAVLHKDSEPLTDKSFEAVTGLIVALSRKVMGAAGLSAADLTAAGVGSPGNLDFDKGVVKNAAAFPWIDAPIADVISAGLGGVPTVLENDANAALLAEWWAGAGAGADVKHIVMLTLGTGIGGGIVSDDRLIRGATGMAGELGHVIVEPHVGRATKGRLCAGTNVHGVFERYASASAVAQRAVDALQAKGAKGSSLHALGAAVTAKDVFEHAAAGDAVAAELVEHTAEYLAVGAINACRAFDPQVIVMTGGLALSGDQLFSRVQKYFDQHHWSIQPATCVIVPAKTGNAAGMIGAAAAARMRYGM